MRSKHLLLMHWVQALRRISGSFSNLGAKVFMRDDMVKLPAYSRIAVEPWQRSHANTAAIDFRT